MSLHEIDELTRRLSVNRHEVVVCVLREQLVDGRSHVRPVLDETLRTRVELTHLAFGAIVGEEPVVADRLRVFFPRQAYDFCSLLFAPRQLPLCNRPTW